MVGKLLESTQVTGQTSGDPEGGDGNLSTERYEASRPVTFRQETRRDIGRK